MRFNLSRALPADAIIDQAWLNLYLEGGEGNINIFVAPLNGEWTEYSVTWNNQPQTGEPVLARPVDTGMGLKGLEVTDIVLAWREMSNYGLVLFDTDHLSAFNGTATLC